VNKLKTNNSEIVPIDKSNILSLFTLIKFIKKTLDFINNNNQNLISNSINYNLY
jgi:hypothetical protein